MQLITELIKQIKGLPPGQAKEVYDFVRFLKTKEIIDPDQMYFWTRKWQANEKAAERDKKEGMIIGNGTPRDLIARLKE